MRIELNEDVFATWGNFWSGKWVGATTKSIESCNPFITLIKIC